MITKEKSPRVRGIEGMVYKRGWREESEGGNCNYILIKNIINKKMAWHVKALVTQLDDLSLLSGTHMEEAEN